MSSIKQLIINAIIKVSGENPSLDATSEFSAQEARDDFIRLLMLELFPEETANVTVAVTETAAPATSPKKSKKPKTTKPAAEPPAAEAPASPAKVTKAEKDAAKAAAAAAKEAAKLAKAAEKEAKKAASPKKSPKKEAPAAEEAPASPAKSPKKEKAPKAPKKVKPAEDANLPKIDPTWRKHLKKADKDGGKERETELLAYLNALTKEEFNAKKAEDHVTAFLTGRVTVDDGKVDAALEEVEFEGKVYFINAETKRVYEGEGECDAEGNWTNYKPVGYVGMAAFAKMEV